jgi:hypothetical protein
MNVGASGTATLAVFLRHLIDAYPLLSHAIEIFRVGKLQLLRGLKEIRDERIARAQFRYIHRTFPAVVLVIKVFIAFRLSEIRQHIVVRPAGVPERGPPVVIGAMSTDINHRVDRARATERTSTGLIPAPPVEPPLRHGLERPIVDFRWQHQRSRDRRIDAGVARF